jgi:hypothetical protein
VGHDVVAVKHAACLMAQDRHGDPFRLPGAHRFRAAVRWKSWRSIPGPRACLLARGRPGRAKVPASGPRRNGKHVGNDSPGSALHPRSRSSCATSCAVEPDLGGRTAVPDRGRAVILVPRRAAARQSARRTTSRRADAGQ